jgi:hypothetical protein
LKFFGGSKDEKKNKKSPNTGRGKRLKICESMLHTGARFCEPLQLRKKVEDHGLDVLSLESTSLGYFLTEVKRIQK